MLYMLSGVVAAAGVVAYYSLSTLLMNDGLSGKGTATEFIDYISDFVSGKSSLVLLVSYIIVLASIIIVFKVRKRRLSAYSGMTHVSFISAVGSVLLGAAVSVLTYSLIPATETSSAEEFSRIALLCVLVGPFVEELMFRGILLKMFGASCGIAVSVFITSALFAASHGNMVQVIYTFILGVILCVVRIKSTSLWSAWLVHLVFNITGAMLAVCAVDLSDRSVLVFSAVAVIAFIMACSGGRKPLSAGK